MAQPTTAPPPSPTEVVSGPQLDPTARCEPFNASVCADVIPRGRTHSASPIRGNEMLTARSVPIYLNASNVTQSTLALEAADIASATPRLLLTLNAAQISSSSSGRSTLTAQRYRIYLDPMPRSLTHR